jgi:hypothetical protein
VHGGLSLRLEALGSAIEPYPRPTTRNRRPRPVDTSGIIDSDELDAIAEAVLADEDETLPLPVGPGLVLELAYDGSRLFAAAWRSDSWWRVAEIGEA